MGRIIAIDYGKKRVGIAVTDPCQIIANILTALGRKLPDIPIVMYDERFTSVLAHKAMIEGGAKKKQRQDKAIIDAISATIILQSYMESQRNLKI